MTEPPELSADVQVQPSEGLKYMLMQGKLAEILKISGGAPYLQYVPTGFDRVSGPATVKTKVQLSAPGDKFEYRAYLALPGSRSTLGVLANLAGELKIDGPDGLAQILHWVSVEVTPNGDITSPVPHGIAFVLGIRKIDGKPGVDYAVWPIVISPLRCSATETEDRTSPEIKEVAKRFRVYVDNDASKFAAYLDGKPLAGAHYPEESYPTTADAPLVIFGDVADAAKDERSTVTLQDSTLNFRIGSEYTIFATNNGPVPLAQSYIVLAHGTVIERSAKPPPVPQPAPAQVAELVERPYVYVPPEQVVEISGLKPEAIPPKEVPTIEPRTLTVRKKITGMCARCGTPSTEWGRNGFGSCRWHTAPWFVTKVMEQVGGRRHAEWLRDLGQEHRPPTSAALSPVTDAWVAYVGPDDPVHACCLSDARYGDDLETGCWVGIHVEDPDEARLKPLSLRDATRTGWDAKCVAWSRSDIVGVAVVREFMDAILAKDAKRAFLAEVSRNVALGFVLSGDVNPKSGQSIADAYRAGEAKWRMASPKMLAATISEGPGRELDATNQRIAKLPMAIRDAAEILGGATIETPIEPLPKPKTPKQAPITKPAPTIAISEAPSVVSPTVAQLPATSAVPVPAVTSPFPFTSPPSAPPVPSKSVVVKTEQKSTAPQPGSRTLPSIPPSPTPGVEGVDISEMGLVPTKTEDAFKSPQAKKPKPPVEVGKLHDGTDFLDKDVGGRDPKYPTSIKLVGIVPDSIKAAKTYISNIADKLRALDPQDYVERNDSKSASAEEIRSTVVNAVKAAVAASQKIIGTTVTADDIATGKALRTGLIEISTRLLESLNEKSTVVLPKEIKQSLAAVIKTLALLGYLESRFVDLIGYVASGSHDQKGRRTMRWNFVFDATSIRGAIEQIPKQFDKALETVTAWTEKNLKS